MFTNRTDAGPFERGDVPRQYRRPLSPAVIACKTICAALLLALLPAASTVHAADQNVESVYGSFSDANGEFFLNAGRFPPNGVLGTGSYRTSTIWITLDAYFSLKTTANSAHRGYSTVTAIGLVIDKKSGARTDARVKETIDARQDTARISIAATDRSSGNSLAQFDLQVPSDKFNFEGTTGGAFSDLAVPAASAYAVVATGSDLDQRSRQIRGLASGQHRPMSLRPLGGPAPGTHGTLFGLAVASSMPHAGHVSRPTFALLICSTFETGIVAGKPAVVSITTGGALGDTSTGAGGTAGVPAAGIVNASARHAPARFGVRVRDRFEGTTASATGSMVVDNQLKTSTSGLVTITVTGNLWQYDVQSKSTRKVRGTIICEVGHPGQPALALYLQSGSGAGL